MGNCNLCPLSLPSQVRGQGPSNPKLIVIGENPTGDDEKSGLPFTAGKDPSKDYPNLIVPRILSTIGIQREEVYWAYALRCNPWHRKEPIKVKPQFRATCRSQSLEPELADIDCPIILACGDGAMKSLLPDLEGGLGKNRGQWHEAVIGGRKRLIRLTFAPNFVHNNSMFHAIQLTNGKIVKDARWNPPGSCAWFFQRDMKAVEAKLKELGTL